MTTSWPRPELAAGPVCQQFRERDAGPAVFPAGAGSSMERAARRRTARRTVGAGILPQNGPGRQAEHRGLSWSWGTEEGQLPKSGFSPLATLQCAAAGAGIHALPSRGPRPAQDLPVREGRHRGSPSASRACFASSCPSTAARERTTVDGLGVRHLVEGRPSAPRHVTSNSCSALAVTAGLASAAASAEPCRPQLFAVTLLMPLRGRGSIGVREPVDARRRRG